MKAALLVSLALAGAPAIAHAQVGVSVGVSFGAPPGEAIPSVDVFYDQLSPYGVWVNDPRVGAVFIPETTDYVPYQNGHWEYTDVGMVWVSDEPFAWATSHYGRWFFSDVYNRWAWMPDTTWGPSWVEWSAYGDNFGWAPLAPEVIISAGYSAPIYGWNYVPAARIVDPDLHRYYVPRDRVAQFHREARPLQTYANVGDHRVVAGPPATLLRQHNVNVQPRRLEPKQMGRMQPQEVQQAVTRAQQRRPQIEQQNQQRLQKQPNIRAAQEKTGVQRPLEQRPKQEARPQTQTQPRPEPQTRPEQQPRPMPQTRPEQTRPEQQPRPMPQTRPEPQQRPEPQTRPAPQQRPEPQTRPAPQQRPEPQTRPEPQQRPEPQTRPEPQQRPEPQSQAQPQPRPAPQAREPAQPQQRSNNKRDDKRRDQ
jgi:hypothetical protein